ncbi:hypothetical protein XELAEV_180369612mg, partial [Xenopus laevis]
TTSRQFLFPRAQAKA